MLKLRMKKNLIENLSNYSIYLFILLHITLLNAQKHRFTFHVSNVRYANLNGIVLNTMLFTFVYQTADTYLCATVSFI